ncbi:hypothetical protein CAP35_08650 [Chitinophagaceae bacterium IBVUCB1]|nr:hypothetical protein CAP35_08650 [Chitinophagaceae bacterium IBVUCB1]
MRLRPFVLVNILFVLALLGIDILYLTGYIAWWWLLVVIVIYLHLLVLGAIYIGWNFYLYSHNKGKSTNAIALSFDDGPAACTAAILDVLKQQNVPAAFFTIGKNAVANPDLVARWHSEGHLIGNHSYEHGFNFDWKSAKAMLQEINKTNEAVKNITGVTPLLFRPPYGVTNPNVAKAVRLSGMQSVGWSLRSFDTKAKHGDVLVDKLLRMAKGGDVILLHDSMPVTAEILTEFITKAREKGFTFVRVDELLALQAYV